MPYPKRILDVDVTWTELRLQEITYIPCNICGTFDYEPLASLTINSSEFFLVRCKRCRLIWKTPLPGKTFSYGLYSEKYFDVIQHSPHLIDQVGIADIKPEARTFRDAISDEVIKTWIRLGVVPKDQAGATRKLLEIGGGRGYLQHAAARAGWDTIGIEISPFGIKEAITNGFLVYPIPLDELSVKYVPYKGFFDVVVFYDFLEHVDDPSRVLRMIRSLLKDDGVIIFRVPETTDCPCLHLIDHVWHFEPSTLDVLLRKEQFCIWRAHYSGTFKASNGMSMENITFYARKLSKETSACKVSVEINPLESWLRQH